MASETLHIRVRGDGTRVVTRGIKGIGEAANVASRQIFIMRRALRTLFVAGGLRAITRMVTSFTEMNNKVRAVLKSEKLLVGTRKDLLSVSKDSRTSMDAIVQLYTRTTRAAKGLGKSESELRTFTKALAQETILSGASSIEAANAIRQLTQGMGPAGLKGEELRSVLEQLPTVAEKIAEEMGVSVNELRKLGEQGEITGAIIIEAFLKASDSIDSRFQKSLVTLPQAMQVLTDQATEFFGELDQGLGISRALGEFILRLSQDIGGNLTTALQLAGGASIAFFGTFAKAAFMGAPFIALIALLREADLMVKGLTGGTSGLGLVMQLAGENFQKLGVYVKSVLDDVVKIISAMDELPNLQGFIDGAAMRFAREDPAAKASIRNEALSKLKTTQQFANLVKSGDVSKNISIQKLDALAKSGKGIFSETVPLFNVESEGGKNINDAIVAMKLFFSGENAKGAALKVRQAEAAPKVTRPGGPLAEAFQDALEKAASDFDVRSLNTLQETKGTRSVSQAGLQTEAARLSTSRREVELRQKILLLNRQIEGVAESAGEKQKEVAKSLTEQLVALQDGVDSLEKGNLDNLKTVLTELRPELDKLQKAEAVATEDESLAQQVQKQVAEFDKLIEGAKKIGPEAEAAAKASVEATAAIADAAILESANVTAQKILDAYAQVLAKISAVAAAVSSANITGGGVQVGGEQLPGEGLSGKLNNGTDPFGAGGGGGGSSDPIAGIEAANDSLKKVLTSTQKLNAEGPQAFKSMGNAAKNFGDTATNAGNEMQQAFSSIFSSLEDALVGFVTTGKLDFKSLINSIIADLARMLIQMLIIKPLMGFFGGFFGGIFGFSGGGSVGGAFGLPGFDGGGFVQDNPAVPARFATGGRVHGPGTGVSDSVNALLSRDEFVVNAAASRPNMAGLEYLNSTGRMPGGGNVTSVAYAPNVSITVEGNSDNAAGNGAQIAKDFEQQMRAQFNEFVAQEQRPGGAFSKTNEDVI